MTVQELIEQLQTLDPQLEVYAEFFLFYPVLDVQTMTLTDEDIVTEGDFVTKQGFGNKQVLVITF